MVGTILRKSNVEYVSDAQRSETAIGHHILKGVRRGFIDTGKTY